MYVVDGLYADQLKNKLHFREIRECPFYTVWLLYTCALEGSFDCIYIGAIPELIGGGGQS